MELRAGYKQTEIGVIPSDWEVTKLGTIANIVGGGTPSSFINSYWNGDVNWFTPTEIGKDKYSYQSIRKISKLGYENCSAKMLPIGTILLTTRAGIGDVSILMQEGCTNQGFQSFIVKSEVENEYLYYLIATLKNTFIQNASGSTFLEISPNKIRAIEIPLPSKTEQTAIAKAISDADALINGLEKLIAKKRNIKQGAMQKLLQPKEGWEVKKLGNFLDYEQPTEYLVSDTEYNDNNQTPVLTAGKTFILGYTNEEHGIFKNLPVIIFDDFTTAIKYVDFPFKAKSSAMKMLIPKNDKVNLRFVFEIMLQIKYQVADHKRHWIGEFSKLEITVPPTPEEQTRIATILSDMDAEITTLETKLNKCKNIKLGMMQNLLTGKIRLV